VILVLFVASQLAEFAMPDLRYAKYLLPVVALGITGPLLPQGVPFPFARRELRDFVILASLVVATSLVTARVHDAPMTRTLYEAYFVMAPLITSYVIFPSLRVERIPVYADWLFFGTTGAYLIECGWSILGEFTRGEGIWVRFLLSSGAAESSASFVFGLIMLYYLFTGRRTRALWAAGLLLASAKRSAMVGSLVCGLVWGIIRITRADVRRHWRLIALSAVGVNTLILGLLYSLSAGNLDELVYRYTGMSTNWFTEGRQTLYANIFSRFGITWSGSGLGVVTSYLEAMSAGARNPHSEVIKYAIEVGPLLSAAWIWTLYRLARGSTAALLFVLYTNVVFISDNVSIYFGYMFVLYVLIGFRSVQEDGSVRDLQAMALNRAFSHDRGETAQQPEKG
jgi:hypothetical protein